MTAQGPARRLYERLLVVQVELLDADDQEAHDILADGTLDPLWARVRAEEGDA